MIDPSNAELAAPGAELPAPGAEPVQGGSGLAPEDEERLRKALEAIELKAKNLVGYPCNQTFDYQALLPFLAYHINNVGDPFAESNYGPNTHEFEREVIEIYSRLTEAPRDNHWGYVTNGGTEGNLYGLYLARELYPDGIVYYSEDTHYSVPKSLRMLRSRSIMIRSQKNGEIDYEDLSETMRIHRDAPPIVFANVGTTMTGAHDNVGEIRRRITDLRIPESYIHVDAALSGMILPFVDSPGEWNFSAGADSISTSGHKMIGSPLPSGMVLAKKANVDRIARSVEYVGVLDTTLTGSRNAFTPLVLWTAMKRLGDAGMRRVVRGCLQLADSAIDQLKQHGVPAWRNNNSITVVFPRPSDEVVKKWQIAPFQDIGHLITMPHVTPEMVSAFISDYLQSPPGAPRGRSVAPPGSHAVHSLSDAPPAPLPEEERS